MARKILIIEDDPGAARLAEYALDREGYQVVIAANGVDGMRKAQEEQPDLLILDIMLPGLDGFEICHRLRAESGSDHLPILMISAKAQESDKAAALKVGADEYLVKPADPAEVVDRVGNLLAGKSAVTSSARTIAFLGSKGKIGTSTVAANVAVGMAQANKDVLLVDLAPYCGGIPALLGLKPERTFAEFSGIPEGTLDRHLVEGTLITHSTGVRTLCSPQAVEGSRELSPDAMISLFEVLQTMGEYVLLDVPSSPSEADKAVLSKCDFIVLVTGSGHAGLATAGATTALLDRLGVGRDRLGAVAVDLDGLLSDVEHSMMVTVVESIIGITLLEVVPHDVNASLEFESQGVPVILAEPLRPMAASLKQVADRLMSHCQENGVRTDG